MIVSRIYENAHRVAIGILFVLTVLIGVFLFGVSKQGMLIDTDLRALLPRDTQNELVQQASDRLMKKVGNRIVLLLGSADLSEAINAAKIVEQELMKSESLLWPGSKITSDQSFEIIARYKQYRHHLLSEKNRDELSSGNEKFITDRAVRLLYGLESWSRVTSPAEDPLGLLNEYILSLSENNNVHSINDGIVVLDALDMDGRFYALLTANLGSDALDMSVQQAMTVAIENILRQLKRDFPDVNMLKSGMVFHAAQAAEQAKKEATIISLGSAIGIIILFVFAFGSPYPLLLGIGSLTFGCLTAITICGYIFNNIHVLTLVFGASLIGVTIDYSLHYFVRLHNLKLATSRLVTLTAIFPSISLGLITTVIGYSFLIQAALPGLIQIAVFSIAGVIGAWFFVVCIYPFAIKKCRTHPPLLLSFSSLPMRFWQGLRGKASVLLLGVMVLFSIVVNLHSAKTSDSVRSLHLPVPELIKQEGEIQKIFKNYAPNQFYLVAAESEQALLQAEELFLHKLDELVDDRVIESYGAITKFLPSVRRQKINYELLESNLYGEAGLAMTFMADAGFNATAFDVLQQDFLSSKGEYLLPKTWLISASDEQGTLWLGEIGATHASLITLYGISDIDILKETAAETDEVIFVNKVEELTAIMGMQRQSASFLLVSAYMAVMLLLWFYYRRWHAVTLVFIPALSTLLALALLTLGGAEITIFHIFAMFLILGLGMDYSIFIYESSSEDKACLLAIALSAATSCLSFGLLSLSSTPMLNVFGVTVLLGSLFNWALAPLVKLPLDQVMLSPDGNE